MLNYTRLGLINLTWSVIFLVLTLGIQTQWSRIVPTPNLFLLFPILSSIMASYAVFCLAFGGQNKSLSSVGRLLFLQLVFNLIGLSLPYAFVKLSLGVGLALLLPLPGYGIFFLHLPQCLGDARLRGLLGVLVGMLWVFLSEYAFGANIAGYLPITLFNIFGLLLLLSYFFVVVLVMLSSSIG